MMMLILQKKKANPRGYQCNQTRLLFAPERRSVFVHRHRHLMAPLVITNGFEYYFQDCDFTGGGRGPDHPAVLLRGANATSYNGTFARTPYVYMVSFDRSEFVMGGVLYEQTAQLDNVRPLALGSCLPCLLHMC